MKLFLCLALFAATVLASPVDRDGDRIPGENGWYVPQSDGSLQWMDMQAGEDLLDKLAVHEGRDLSLTPVSYYLYTKSNPTKSQQIKATDKSILGSNFNPSHPTKFVIHGWTQDYKAGMNKNIRNAYLGKGDFNIIIVDWARARSVEYASSVLAVSTVGEKVAKMIDFLVTNHGMSLQTLSVIGHSLGAHVAGYAGKNVKTGKINTIVGLDPALPLFIYNKPNKRLNSEDATYVETIQTNGGTLGFLKPIGKASFYPNGGESQPGCFLDVTGACSHGRSTTYYAEAVEKNDFPTINCPDYNAAVKNQCGSTYSSVRMANPSNAVFVSGDYYVPVNSKAPYGQGN